MTEHHTVVKDTTDERNMFGNTVTVVSMLLTAVTRFAEGF
jgi:hypothetical protein